MHALSNWSCLIQRKQTKIGKHVKSRNLCLLSVWHSDFYSMLARVSGLSLMSHYSSMQKPSATGRSHSYRWMLLLHSKFVIISESRNLLFLYLICGHYSKLRNGDFNGIWTTRINHVIYGLILQFLNVYLCFENQSHIEGVGDREIDWVEWRKKEWGNESSSTVSLSRWLQWLALAQAKPGSRSFPSFPTLTSVAQIFKSSFAAFPGHYQGAGSAVDQPGHPSGPVISWPCR